MPRKSPPPAEPKPRILATFPRRLEDLVRPSPDEEARLLAAAKRINELAPWETLTEDDFFAVQNPENGDFGFVSVIGALGELHGVVLYRDIDAFFGLQRVREALELDPDPDFQTGLQLLQISQLQARFEPKEELSDDDLALLKRHKIKVAAKGTYPHFKSIRPGYLPWLIDGEEARFLAVALEQLAVVFDRPISDPAEFEVKGIVRRGVEIYDLFTRETSDGQDWRDTRREFPPPGPAMFELPIEDGVFTKIAAKPFGKKPMEIAMTVFPVPVAQPDERPFLPGAMVMMQGDEVVGQTLTSQGYSTAAVPEIIMAILESLAQARTRPKEIWISEPKLNVLASFQQLLGIKVVVKEELPTADEAIQDMIDFVIRTQLGGGPPIMPGDELPGAGGLQLH